MISANERKRIIGIKQAKRTIQNIARRNKLGAPRKNDAKTLAQMKQILKRLEGAAQ